MLYEKCNDLDVDGMDLRFTRGDAKVLKAKKKNGRKHFLEMMQHKSARPTRDVETNMEVPLNKLLDTWLKSYNDRSKAKPHDGLTIYVLTDGKWLASSQNNPKAVDQVIIDFHEGLKRATNTLMPQRLLTIQFISFGNDPVALERLRRLDNDLKFEGVK